MMDHFTLLRHTSESFKTCKETTHFLLTYPIRVEDPVDYWCFLTESSVAIVAEDITTSVRVDVLLVRPVITLQVDVVPVTHVLLVSTQVGVRPLFAPHAQMDSIHHQRAIRRVYRVHRDRVV